MQIKTYSEELTVSQIKDLSEVNLSNPLTFLAHTKDELSLVCPTEVTPKETIKRDDHWRIFRIEGQLDFSLIGILAKISQILAEEKISIFAESTYDTDYVLIKSQNYEAALDALAKHGYEII